MGQSAHECSTLRPSFPLEKMIRVKDLSNQLQGEFRAVTEERGPGGDSVLSVGLVGQSG